MDDERLMFMDIKTDSVIAGKAATSFWNQGDDSFRFNFFSEGSAVVQKETKTDEPPQSQVSTSSTFAFNFQIEEEDMAAETSDTPATCSRVSGDVQDVPSSKEPSKSKKKKRSGKKKGASVDQPQDPSDSIALEENVELSAEEQLNRELDWCIEQLQTGLSSQKATSRQKEEASRALKTLRSSKAPLVKKRQVMRAMAGDYRKKMEEEKSKQFKMIQTELSAAKVKPVSSSPKKCVFNRIAEVKSTAAEENTPDGDSSKSNEEKFVFTASTTEFRFNFL